MATLLIVTWWGGGNVDPTIGIAQRLLDARVDVTALGPPSLVARFAAIGVPLAPRDPAGERNQGTMAADVLAAIERTRPDLVLVDYMMPGALCAAEAAGVPVAALVHTSYGAMRVHDEAPAMGTAATVDGTNALRAELGLPSITRFGELLDGARVVVVTCPRQLDAVPDPLAANVRYVGPVFERIAVEPAPRRELPRVVVSLGTTDMDERPVLERVLRALAAEPFEVVATVGEHLDSASIRGAANARVTGRVPHATVMPGAAAVVCHAGLGTILAALRHGVPLVCIPLGRDQPLNAAAVATAGVGRVVSRDAGTDEIREAVTAVAIDGPEHVAAARFAATLAEPEQHPAVEVLLAALNPR